MAVAPRPGEILFLFETMVDYKKRCRNKTNAQTFPGVAFKLEFQNYLNLVSTPKVSEVCTKLPEKQRSVGGLVERGQRHFDFAGASGSRVGPFRKLQKTYEKRILRTITRRMSLFYRGPSNNDIVWELFGTDLGPILVTTTARSCDKRGAIKHQA